PFAELAADAALFVAAPGRFDVGRLHVVDPHDAGTQALDGTHRAKYVARPDGGRQAVVRVVRDAQGVGLFVERDDAGDRTEDLLARDTGRVVDVIEDRRLDEKAAVEHAARGASAADRHLRFSLADLLVLTHALELLATDERSHLRVAAHPRTEGDAPRL